MSRVALVTGAAGQDGWYVSELLLARGWDVHGLVRPGAPTGAVVPGVTVHEGDLRDASLPSELVRQVDPEVVVHLAGLSSVARSWQEPVLTAEVNGLAVSRVLQACGVERRVLLASSAEVFAGSQEQPQHEGTTMAPRSPYGASKAYVRHLAQVHRAGGAHVSAAVLYNHESPRRPATFVTAKIAAGVAAVAAGRQDELVLGNLDAVRDWGWAPEYADAMVRMVTADEPGDLVLATGVACSVRQFVAAAFAAVGIDDWQAHVRSDEALHRQGDAGRLVGDASLARSRLGWTPTTAGVQVAARLTLAHVAGEVGGRPVPGVDG